MTSQPSVTTLELAVLEGIYKSEYADGGTRPEIWSWSIRQSIATPAQVPGVVSSLVKKGLVVSSGGSDDERTVKPTELGYQVALANGADVPEAE